MSEIPNRSEGDPSGKKYLVGAQVNPDGSVDLSRAVEWDRGEKEFKPVTPRGWTFLRHGTNLLRWGENNPYTSDTIEIVKPLSAISQEDFEKEKNKEGQRTTKTYSSSVRPEGMTEKEFAQTNKPFEMRIIFYKDFLHYKDDPEYIGGLDKKTMDKIVKYYQDNRHPVVPKKEVLQKLGYVQEEGRDVFYFIPESVSAAYEEESSQK